MCAGVFLLFFVSLCLAAGSVNVKQTFDQVVLASLPNGVPQAISTQFKKSYGTGTCDFEQSLCGWQDVSTGIISWSNVSASIASGSQPKADTTLPGGSAGHYVIVGRGSGISESPAMLASPVLLATSLSCHMMFSYFKSGPGSGQLSISLQNLSDTETSKVFQLWSEVGQGHAQWAKDSVDISQVPAGMQIVIISKQNDPSTAVVAVDDLEFIQCQKNDSDNLTITSLDCSFTGGSLCGFYQLHMDDFDWTLGTGPTPSLGTGPASDHTTGTGDYIYIETSAPQKPGDKAMLISAMMPPTGRDMCLKFWCHMFGLHVGMLNIYLVTGPNSSNYTRIWTRSASQGNVWRQGQAPVSSNIIWQIAFEGVVGASDSGDIALDDISISMEKCPPQVVCDFEIDQCGYIQPRTETFRWTRSSNVVDSWGTHPSIDHTTKTGNGFYMLLDASVAESGDSARLLSPLITVTGSVSHCVYFWYHMIGENVGQLNVYASTDDFGDNLIWSNSQSRGDYWTQGRATIDSSLDDFSVKFEGQVWAGFVGDIALDDIRITEGTCPHIGSCDFEYDMCGYYNTEGLDTFDWLRNSGETSLSNIGPPVDHTTNTDEGFYTYTETNNQQVGSRALLYSDFIPFTNGSCVAFWYYMHGQDVGTLQVSLIQVNNISRILWQLSGNQGEQWKFVQANLSSSEDYQIVFDGESDAGGNGDIAIDDILVTDTICVSTTVPPPTDVTAVVTVTSAPSIWDCNFDKDTLCIWTQDTSDTMNWSLQKGATATDDTGPSADHTSGDGYYIYTESSFRSHNDTARIISTTVPVTKYGVCLKFWYNMYGSDIGTLSVYSKQGDKLGSSLWTRTGDQSKNWLAGNMFISSNSAIVIKVQFVFEASLNTGYEGVIALDDISINIGSCVEIGGSCDFEAANICGFTQDTTDDFDWTRSSGNTINQGTGPNTDHSTGTSVGFYMYTESSSPRAFNDKARLIGPTLRATDGRCLQFFYHMRGQNMGTLNVYESVYSQLHTPLWTLSGQQRDTWLPAQVTLLSALDFKIVFEGIIGDTGGSDIAIDDITFVPGSCPAPATCDFESGSCLFTNSFGDDTFDWNIYQGSTYTNGGPSTDHTLQTALGHYMLADTHDKNKGDRARLYSEALPPTTASCFIFSVSMSSVASGTVLSVNVDTNMTGFGHFDNRMFYSPQTIFWLPGSIDIVSAVPYMIMFEVEVQTPGNSDVAIDDVMLIPGQCPHKTNTFDCGNGNLISASKVCDYHQDCANNADEALCGNCAFETDLCGYLDVSKGSIAWKQATDSEADDVGTRIGADHTLKTTSGHFLYITQKKGTTYSPTAILTTPELKPTFKTCQFQFYYKKSAGTLQVYIQIGSRDVLIWETQNLATGNIWARALVNIGRYRSPIRVLIQGTRSYTFSTIVAIDDTRFLNCGLPPTSASCQNNQLQCANHVCYNKIFKCDLTDDCGDGSDESDCKSATQCNFETGLCLWTQDVTDDLNWTRNAGKTGSPNTGPCVDHSTGLDTGFYLYLETSAPAKAGQKALLLSPVIRPAQVSDDCHLSFFYHMYGDSMGPLNIYIATEKEGNSTLLFTRQNYDQDFWDREVLFLNSTKNFQIIIEGSVGHSFHGDMAIDDVSFSAGCKLVTSGTTTLPATGYTVTTLTPSNKAMSVVPVTCSPTQFTCVSNGACIDKSRQCDGTWDCVDVSDEKSCSCRNYCQNGGICIIKNGLKKCQCVNNYRGSTCSNPPNATEPTKLTITTTDTINMASTSSIAKLLNTSNTSIPPTNGVQKSTGNDDSWKIPLSVVLSLLGTVVIAVAIVIVLKKTNRIGNNNFQRFGQQNNMSKDGNLTNPAYGNGEELSQVLTPSLQ